MKSKILFIAQYFS